MTTIRDTIEDLRTISAGDAIIVASGALSNGAVVALNADGTVSAAGIPDGSAGTSVVFESASVFDMSATFDSYNNKVVIAYQDGGNSYYGTAVVGTVSGTSISFGTPVIFKSSYAKTISATFDSSNNKVVIAYKDFNDTYYGTAIVGTVSGTSISFGTPVVFESSNTYDISATFDSSNNKVVIAYVGSGNWYGTAVVGTVSGTSISFGTPVTFETDYAEDQTAVFDSSNNKVVIAYVGSTGIAIVGTVSGTSISFGTPVEFDSSYMEYISAGFDSYNNKVIIAYRNYGNSSYGTAVVGTVSGTSISFGTPVVFESASTGYTSVTFDSYNNKVIIAFSGVGSGNWYGTAIVGTVSGTSISFRTPVFFNEASSNDIYAIFDSSNNKVVIAYRDSGNSHYGTSSVFTTGSTNADYWLGISSDSYLDTETATIYKLGDVADNQTGLTTNMTYYVDVDGSLTTSGTDYGEIGRAISATKLLITKGGA